MPPPVIGGVFAAPTASMPPRAFESRLQIAEKQRPASSRCTAGAVSVTRIVTTCSAMKPGSTSSMCRRLCTTSPAHIEQHERQRRLGDDERSAHAKRARPPVDDRPPSRSDARELRTRRAKRGPQSDDHRRQHPRRRARSRARARRATMSSGSRPGGAMRTISRDRQLADDQTPSTAPPIANSALSTMSWLTSRAARRAERLAHAPLHARAACRA